MTRKAKPLKLIARGINRALPLAEAGHVIVLETFKGWQPAADQQAALERFRRVAAYHRAYSGKHAMGGFGYGVIAENRGQEKVS